MDKIHRRHYGLHLSKFESLYDNIHSDKERTAFLRDYQPDTQRLSAFTEIEEDSSINDDSQCSDDDVLANEALKLLGKQTSAEYG